MNINLKFFKKFKSLPVDQFYNNVLYDKNIGYYNSVTPFGKKGDFITAPKISNIFSEMIAIWIISTWENFGKPKNLSLVELGPGDGSLTKVLLEVFRRFKNFDKAKQIYLFEISKLMKKKQKQNLNDKSLIWISDLGKIKKGPVIFFGNEFFDAIPIKQFKRKNNILFEKYYSLNNKKISEVFKEASSDNIKIINSYKSLNKINFIEFPKKGFAELKKITNVLSKLSGCILLIDYGYLKSHNQDTLQSVYKHKRNNLLKNLGKADITSHVNFELLKEFFMKNKLKVKKTLSQKEFLENLGINTRAEILSKNMKFSEQSNMFLRLRRLLSPKLMGSLFKVILAYKYQCDKYSGFK